MALLQVRDFPQELYEALTHVAKEEHRSTPQQTVILLREALGRPDERAKRRKSLLGQISESGLSLTADAREPADLVREDRDR
ncbi:MAG: hypothetical protein LBL54_05050 [Clostridiales Family XIII bacterium]|jgi:hypothetical protein|nr:hypothetical protein [Clostridiales Family XIII bacterium]